MTTAAVAAATNKNHRNVSRFERKQKSSVKRTIATRPCFSSAQRNFSNDSSSTLVLSLPNNPNGSKTPSGAWTPTAFVTSTPMLRAVVDVVAVVDEHCGAKALTDDAAAANVATMEIVNFMFVCLFVCCCARRTGLEVEVGERSLSYFSLLSKNCVCVCYTENSIVSRRNCLVVVVEAAAATRRDETRKS